MPTFTDLYYQGPTNIGNPELKPEKTASLEGGVKLSYGFVQGYWLGFYRKGKNIIDWVKQNESEKWQPQNLTELNSLGTEIQFQFYMRKHFGHKLPNLVSVGYFFNNLNKNEGQDLISNYVLDNLKHKIVGTINQTIFKDFTIELKVLYQDREGSYTQFDINKWGSEVKYEPFWIFDGRINYTLKKLQLNISANNIFNTDYVDIGNIKQPGRWIKGGISYQIDFK